MAAAGIGNVGRLGAWIPNRLELKEWRDWNDMKLVAIGIEEVLPLPAALQTMTGELMEATAQEQGRFQGKNGGILMVSGGARRLRSSVLQKALVDTCLQVWGKTGRIKAEISPERKPMSKAYATWLSTMVKVRLDRDFLT